MFLVHEEKAEYSSWLIYLLALPIGLVLAAIVFGVNRDLQPALVFLAEAGIFSLIFYFLAPRKYQIYQDRLKIVLGSPFSIDLRLSTIREATRSSGSKAYAFSGVRFATSSRFVIEILRDKGLNYVISPQNGQLFLEQLNLAMKKEK
jgi:hypothetical protein